MSEITVAAFYRFVTLADFESLREPLRAAMRERNVFGTVLLAQEGINGTVAGERASVDCFIEDLRKHERLAGLEVKLSTASDMPFRRQKVKLKREIVTMGVAGIDPTELTGQHVDPQEWNELLDDPDVVVVDARNDYEVGTGSFAGAVNPKTAHFRELPAWLDNALDPDRQPKVAMYCTGGIRCEKSTAYLRARGFNEVYQLRGGILKYLEQVPAEQSRWAGECFVFDDRVTVNHRLEQGDFSQCHACRMPLSAADRESKHYVAGISCPHCVDKTTDQQRQGFAEREKQMELAKARGEKHLAR